MINCKLKVEDKGFSGAIPHDIFKKKIKTISILHYGNGILIFLLSSFRNIRKVTVFSSILRKMAAFN